MFDYKTLNLTEEELDELQQQLNKRKEIQQYEKYIDTINEHKKYIGLCFKEKKKEKYIRVLSSKSSNQYRFECMCFEFPINITENHRLTKIFRPENAFSNIEFNSIYIEDYPLLCTSFINQKVEKVIDSLIPISEDEYFSKMKEYVNELETSIKNGLFDTSKNNKSMFDKT